MASASTASRLYQVTPAGTVTLLNSNWSSGGPFYPYVATDVEFANGFFYSQLNSNTLRVVNAATGAVTGSLLGATSNNESGAAVIGNFLYTTDGNASANIIYKWDLTASTVIPTTIVIPVSSFETLESGCNPNELIYCGNNMFRRIDLTTNSISAVIATVGGNRSSHFALLPDGLFAFYYQHTTGKIQRVNLTTGLVTDFITNIPNNGTYNDLEFGPSTSGSGISLYFTNATTLFEVSGFSGSVLCCIPPQITCPANTIINFGDNESPAANGEATATEGFNGVTITYADATSNVVGNNKTITRTWTATDGASNTAACNQTITVCDLGVSLGNNRYVFFGIPGSPGASGVITATPSGGLTGVTYLWSSSDASVNGLTTQSVTPSGYTDAQAITYTVTATAPNGCTATASVTITYFNVNCSTNGNNVKVKVCHIPQDNPTNCNSICVSINAYQALLDNGSYLGQCLPNCEAPPQQRGIPDISNYIVGKQTLDVKVFSNPSHTFFGLFVYGDFYQKVSLRVLDVYGRVIDQKNNLNTEQEIRIGDSYIAGVYMVEVMQGINKKVVKLVKQ